MTKVFCDYCGKELLEKSYYFIITKGKSLHQGIGGMLGAQAMQNYAPLTNSKAVEVCSVNCGCKELEKFIN